MTYDPQYLQKRYRTYNERAVRYRAAARYLTLMGLKRDHSILDIGGGDAEMEKCLREEYGWRGMYTNLDYSTGHDIYDIFDSNTMRHDYVVCLETVEHLFPPFAYRLLDGINQFATMGAVITTPNADVQNVYAMDDTHITPISRGDLDSRGYMAAALLLYEGYYSGGRPDGLVARRRTA